MASRPLRKWRRGHWTKRTRRSTSGRASGTRGLRRWSGGLPRPLRGTDGSPGVTCRGRRHVGRSAGRSQGSRARAHSDHNPGGRGPAQAVACRQAVALGSTVGADRAEGGPLRGVPRGREFPTQPRPRPRYRRVVESADLRSGTEPLAPSRPVAPGAPAGVQTIGPTNMEFGLAQGHHEGSREAAPAQCPIPSAACVQTAALHHSPSPSGTVRAAHPALHRDPTGAQPQRPALRSSRRSISASSSVRAESSSPASLGTSFAAWAVCRPVRGLIPGRARFVPHSPCRHASRALANRSPARRYAAIDSIEARRLAGQAPPARPVRPARKLYSGGLNAEAALAWALLTGRPWPKLRRQKGDESR